jgi:diguanylate cyclase (GGDEF)-like protein
MGFSMKMKILPITESIIFIALITAVVCGFLENIAANVPFALEFTTAIIFLLLLFALFAVLKDINNRLLPYQALGIGALAFTSNHLFTEISGSYIANFPVLYFIVIIAVALIGINRAWILPMIVFVFGEFFHPIVSRAVNGIAFDIASIISQYYEKNIIPVFYLFVSGVFPSIISSHFLRIAFIEKSKAPIKRTETQETPQPPRTDTSQLTKTQVLNAGELQADHKTSIGGVDDLLASVVYFMKRNFKAYSALGFTFDPLTQSFILNSFHSKSININNGISIAAGNGIIGQLADKKIFMSGDLSFYNSGIDYYSSPQEINSILAVPVVSEQNELLGALVLDSVDKNAFRDQDKDILKRFSSLAAALITNARMRIFQEQAARTFQLFYEASHLLTTALNLNDVFDVMLQTGPSVAHCTRQMAILFDDETRMGRIVKISGASPDIPEGSGFPINSGLYSYAFKKRIFVNIPDYQLYKTKYYRFVPNERQTLIIRSLLIFPILDDEGRCKGLYSIESDRPNLYLGETEQTFKTLVENASVAFTRALLYQRMEKLATTDGLTELNNHRHFQELLSKEIERTRRYGSSVALLLMDIDHFKSFNDTYGHPVGDLVLKEISQCIKRSLRTNDIPARYGGEEFTVIIPESNEQGALIIAERIRSAIENHVIISNDRQLRVTVSIGVAAYPSLATNQPQLIDSADKALYNSKEHGRNRVTVYASGMSSGKKK